MTPHDGFLADIIEHPEDGSPLLVSADWFDDHGDAERDDSSDEFFCGSPGARV